jgi:hypothetical protein
MVRSDEIADSSRRVAATAARGAGTLITPDTCRSYRSDRASVQVSAVSVRVLKTVGFAFQVRILDLPLQSTWPFDQEKYARCDV